jgi:hypothetical protein
MIHLDSFGTTNEGTDLTRRTSLVACLFCHSRWLTNIAHRKGLTRGFVAEVEMRWL